MMFGRQNWFCINCGGPIYDIMKWSWWPCCNEICYDEFKLKEAKSIIGKEEVPK